MIDAKKVQCRATDEKNWPAHPYGVRLNIGGAASSPSKGLKRKKAPVSVIDPDRNRHECVNNLPPATCPRGLRTRQRQWSCLDPEVMLFTAHTQCNYCGWRRNGYECSYMRRLRSAGHFSGATAVWVETKADQDRIYKMMMDRNRAAKSDDEPTHARLTTACQTTD
jgi:hypothetical protein